MDLFEVYPGLAERDHPLLAGRSLRLISLSGFIFDDEAFYFELGEPRYWGRLAGGRRAIGVGTPKAQPDRTFPPHQALVRYVRKSWRCDVTYLPAGYSYLLDEAHQAHVLSDVEAHIPYMLLFTPPRLGGGDEVPDALVQAAFLLPVQRFRSLHAEVGLLSIQRSGMETFLAREDWSAEELLDQTWAELQSGDHLPDDAQLRPVLTLRGLRHLWVSGALPATLEI